MAHTYTKTVTLTPSSAQNSFSASNWSATNNALGNWVTVAQDPGDATKWNITLTDNNAATQRTTTLTATHPDSGSVQDSFNITQAGSTAQATPSPGQVQFRQYGNGTASEICSGGGSYTTRTLSVSGTVSESAAWSVILNNANVSGNVDIYKIIGLSDGNQNPVMFADGWRSINDDDELGSFNAC